MKKLFGWLFPKWEIFYTTTGDWIDSEDNKVGIAVYEVFYSSRLEDYKLEISGYKPKEHSGYKTVVDYFQDLKNSEDSEMPLEAKEVLDYLVEKELYEAAEMVKKMVK